MTSTSEHPQHSPLPRHSVLAAILIAVTLIASACGGTDSRSDASETLTAPDATPESSALEPTDTPEDAGSPDADPTATPEVTPQSVLADALFQLGDSYLFSSEVLLDGSSVSLATGRNIGEATEVVLEQQDTALSYRSIDVRRWVQTPSGSWERLADTTESASPLAGLDQPTTLQLLSSSASTTELIATYDSSVLSMTTPGDITVTLTITDGALTNLDHTSDLGGQSVELHTTFTAATGLVPIAAP